MNQEILPIYNAINKFKQKSPISFHVPGHKNGFLIDEKFKNIKPFLENDITELTGLDDLHSPEGAIKEAMELLTDYYGTVKSYFLVNGSTVGNLAMILSVCREGDYVMVQRNCHKSILNALKLAKVQPLFIYPEIDDVLGMAGGIDPQLLKNTFEKYKEIKAIIATYPNYYGKTYDLKEIIDLAHHYEIPVLVDEAHGAHFRLGDPFPPSAVELGADMVVHSAHKTLPAMTMGSYLHVNSGRISIPKVEEYLGILQSSSPSYPIMLSLDFSRYFLANFSGEDIEYTLQTIQRFVDGVKRLSPLKIKQDKKGDPLKVSIYMEGVSGFELQRMLEEQGVYGELADPYQVLYILPLLKKGTAYPYADALLRIQAAVEKNMPVTKGITVKNEIDSSFIRSIKPMALTYKEMESTPKETIPLLHSIDRIAAETVIPYPPGIPILMPGEEITNKHIQEICRLLEVNANFQGDSQQLKKGAIQVFC
ncbi:aminotransferase class I/II-fold pyridoxal phosphate-dependent enzyme [Heyndrickxia acidicola]|uniref:Aminotransferase class I/II-fold pyridoxal phosphate-dependent enzyme n=1 Tax=Heyndrickxia acidicola TaxID=209389 RepID=A0ABU6MMY1_9BACI|nr:aminotransferase class I/II-fold pyridoxal phosphate-dependent enzyme [Heyndrickxia acidicola]MED1206033.1 aminotransferase class I/II-fold pyridoxal phosphate-dependent enzyme [Heyndrickxia acidicola]